MQEKDKQKKKILMIATVASMIGQFNMNNIHILLDLGYEVHVACNFYDLSVWSENRIKDFIHQLDVLGIKKIQINFTRSPYDILKFIDSYKKVRKIIKKEKYYALHCHTPVAAMIARLAALNTQTKVIYTAHGFHFYKGAPLKNWLIYYPIEKFLSRYTDVLITINKEDYKRAKDKFRAKHLAYIPGVGVDTTKFAICKVDKKKKRNELGVNEDDFLILSVGELSERKNQKLIIDALGTMKKEGSIEKIVYLAVGQGDMYAEFENLIKEDCIEDHVKLLGFRTDIDELCEVADCFVHPSIREGLGIAPLEAMAAGLPLISTSVNGIKDYTRDGVSGCCIEPTDVNQMIAAIKKMRDNHDFRFKCGSNNVIIAKNFDVHNTELIMEKIYGGGYRHLLNILIRQRIRDQFNLKSDDILMISVGELNENKNQRVIIEAMSLLNNPHIHYCLCGKGNNEENLRNLAHRLGLSYRIHFMGYRQDVNHILLAADVFCFPSKREGLGLAALEAMCTGLPLVTSNIHGINDYSISGINGYSCRANDPHKFAEAINKVVYSPQKSSSMGRGNIQVANEFDITLVNHRMKKIYGFIA